MKARFQRLTGAPGRIGARALLAALVALMVGVVVLPTSALGQSPSPSGSPTPSNSPSGSPTRSPSSSPSSSTSPSASPSPSGPAIKFVNPSAGTTLILSDKPTAQDATYRLVAWVPDAPPGAIVEFELESIPSVTVTAERVIAGDTYEAEFPIPSNVLDGIYDLNAILFAPNEQGETEEQARATVSVRVQQGNPSTTTQAQTADLTYPGITGTTGFAFNQVSKRWAVVLSAVASTGSTFVQFRYTTSAPGTEPTWTSCGNPRTASDMTASTRCTLADKVTPEQVTAVAAIANDSNTAANQGFNTNFNDAADAQRVVPYVQVPTSLDLQPETQVVQSNTNGDFPCSKLIVAKLLDQVGRAIAGQNMDVHAQGPTDQLQFGLGIFDSSSIAGPPDKNHSSDDEPGADCSGLDPAGEFNGLQGEHNIAGAPDRKHIESDATGTSNSGTFQFFLRTDRAGTTQVEAWADENDNDLFEISERIDGASIGWGGDAAPAAPEVFLSPTSAQASLGECIKFTAVARRGGNQISAQNIDVHLTGPDETVAFCDPSGASPRRDPDLGGHSGSQDSNGTTIHQEGETDSNGQFVFGVTASNPGDTEIAVWLDTTDDDERATDDPDATGGVSFSPTGERSISLESNKSRVRKGGSASFTGSIEGERFCEDTQVVKLKKRRAGAKSRFRTVASTATDSEGNYFFKVKVGKRSQDFKAVAPPADPCQRAKSNTVRVRVSR